MHDKMCLYPFTHMFVTQLQTDSEYRLNCCSVNNKDEMHCNGSLLQNYNSDYFRNLRSEHLAGRGLDHSHCWVCKNSEARTGTSPRIANNQHFKNQFNHDFEETIEKIRQQEFKLTTEDIISLEYMPSNYCNYACIICSSFASSQRALVEKMLGANKDYEFTDRSPHGLEEIIANVKILGFAGGETLLQPKVVSMIDDMITKGETDKMITILTNLSKYDPDVYHKLEKFRSCFITFSIDGIGKVGEYQRMRSNWNNMESNLEMIRSNHPSLGYMVNYVVTAVSAVGIPDFLEWAYRNDIQDVMFSPVKNRSYLSIDALPAKVIDRLKQRMESIQALPQRDNLRDFPLIVQRAMNFYESYSFNVEYNKRLLFRMKNEDKLRRDGLSLKDIIPELEDKDV